MLEQLIDETREVCRATLSQPNFYSVGKEVHGCESHDKILSIVRSIDEAPDSQLPLQNLKAKLFAGREIQDGIFERYAILQSSLESLEKLGAYPLPLQVKKLLCDEFRFYAHPNPSSELHFLLGTYRFAAMGKTASLRRFPAGQLDWEMSGLPRSLLLQVRFTELFRILNLIGRKMRGFRPMFTTHLANRRTTRNVLLEIELNRSYFRVAMAMKLQHRVKGFFTTAWFYSPDTLEISPHLAWMNKVFIDNGGMICKLGPAPLDSGVFERSPERKKAYQEGRFTPTMGLVLWPRREMIKWAEQHPELEAERA